MRKLYNVLLLIFLFMIIGGPSMPEIRPDLLNSVCFRALKKEKEKKYIPETDITEQLRNELNASLDVNLPAGRFYVSESIIVQGYSGTIKGAGRNETVIEPTTGFKAKSDPCFKSTFRLTEIFSLYLSKGDVTFKDLTIQIIGKTPAEVHNNPFFGKVTTIDNAIVVSGVHPEAGEGITVTLSDLKITGEPSNDTLSLHGKNLALALVVCGLPDNKPLNAVIRNCEIENCGLFAIEYGDVFDGSGLITGNEIVNSYKGISMSSLTDSLTVLGNVIITDNIFKNMTRGAIFNHTKWHRYCSKNNTKDGVLIPDDCQ